MSAEENPYVLPAVIDGDIATSQRFQYVDAVTTTFAIVMFGIAIPVNAYVLLECADAFSFQTPMVVNTVAWTFPWLPLLLAIAIPVLVVLKRNKLSGRSETVASYVLLATTLLVGLLAFVIETLPVISWLSLL